MTLKEVMAELEGMGSPQIKKILLNHGVKEPLFGVKVEQLKAIVKKIKKDYSLSKQLFDTGNADAMYLAGLIADDMQMSEADLNHWVNHATSNNICEYTVPWVAAGGNFGFKLGLEWIESETEHIMVAGWYTLSQCLAYFSDDKLDMGIIGALLMRIEQEIHSKPKRLVAAMQCFIIAVGSHIISLNATAIETARKIESNKVLQNGLIEKQAFAEIQIHKVMAKGKVGFKKKVLKC